MDKLKSMFSEVEAVVVADVPADEEFKDITTIDGVVLRTSEAGFVDGEKVMIVTVGEDEAEEVADAPEGEYAVEGKTVSVNAEGVIVSVVESEEEAPEEAVVEEEMSEVPSWAKALTSRIEAMEVSNSNLAESMSAIDELSKVVSKIANEPADKPVKMKKSVSEKDKKANTRDSKIDFFRKK